MKFNDHLEIIKKYWVMIFFIIPIVFYALIYIIKQECFSKKEYMTSEGQKYTMENVSKAFSALKDNLKDNYELVKFTRIKRVGALLEFDALLFNTNKYHVQNFYAEVKIPLNSKGKYTLMNSYSTDSKDSIKNGSYSTSESASYKSVSFA